MSHVNPPVASPSLLSRLRRPRPAWWFHWGWWIWITITCCILSAHLVALRTGFAWWALIGCVLALHAAWYWEAHSRVIAWIYGFAVAFYILVLVEIYLGASSLYYGAIGSINRPDLPGDKIIIAAFTAFYRFGNDYRSLFGLLATVVLYGVLGLVLARTSVSWLADWLAGVLAVLYVLLAFPFTHPFETKQVGMRDAMFEASAALRSIGSYDEAAKEVAKETDQLERLLSELDDPKLAAKRKELSDEVRRYATSLAILDEHKHQKVNILRQSNKTYQSRSALPKEPRRYPPRSEPDFSSKDAEEHASNANPDNILNAWLLTRQARELAEMAKRDQARGVASFLAIHDYVGNVVIDQIGKLNRADLVEIADSNVLQIIALHDLEVAIDELKRRIAELDDEIRNQEQQNTDLERNVANFAANLETEMGREADCANILRQVTNCSTATVVACCEQSAPVLNKREQAWRGGSLQFLSTLPLREPM